MQEFPTGASAPGASPGRAHSHHDAEVEDIVRALRRYGVLRRARLVELCGAAHWSDAGFRQALSSAVASGRVRALGSDLYEIVEPPDRKTPWTSG